MSGKPLNFKYLYTFHCLSKDNNLHVAFNIDTNSKLSRKHKSDVERYICTLVDYLNGGR